MKKIYLLTFFLLLLGTCFGQSKEYYIFRSGDCYMDANMNFYKMAGTDVNASTKTLRITISEEKIQLALDLYDKSVRIIKQISGNSSAGTFEAETLGIKSKRYVRVEKLGAYDNAIIYICDAAETSPGKHKGYYYMIALL